MSSANTLIPAQTAARTEDFNATESDKILAVCTGTGLAGAEVINIFQRVTGVGTIGGGPAGTTPVYDAAGAQAKLTLAIQSILLEGGLQYVFVKPLTAGACGVDIVSKPRDAS